MSKKMKKLPWLVKVLIAGLMAFIVLNVFSFFYYNIPPRVKDDNYVTDYKWPANSFHSLMTEGFGLGRVNNDGYNNPYDYQKGMDIDVLFMGSSHLEGFNISKNKNAAVVLSELNKKTVYNVGISEHTLLRCLSNIGDAYIKYEPKDYIVIETMSVSFYDNELESALNRDNPLPTYSSGILDILQNMKYLKLVYYKYNSLKYHAQVINESITDEKMFNELLSQAKAKCGETKLVIVFHPNIIVDNDGNITTSYNKQDERLLSKLCEDNDIIYINLEETFIDYYLKENKLPYGFKNTTMGFSHLNETGQYLMARKINEVMEGK